MKRLHEQENSMRQISLTGKGAWRIPSPVPDSIRLGRGTTSHRHSSGYCTKVERASLLPGGQTHGAGSVSIRSGNTSSPEPVIGHDEAKEYR